MTAQTVKLPKPKVKELRTLYKRLINPVVANRMAALAEALRWYDQTIDYLGSRGKLGAEAQLAAQEKALKIRRKGASTTSENEREVCYRMALVQYEIVCAGIHPVPVTPYYDQLKQEDAALQAKHAVLGDKYGFVLQTLTAALGPKNAAGQPVQFVVADGTKAKQYSIELNQLVFNRRAAKELRHKVRREGILPVVLDEIATLSRAAALEQKEQGGKPVYMLDPTKQVAALLSMLEHLRGYIKTMSPKKLVRRVFDGQELDGAVEATADKPKRTGRPIPRPRAGEEKVAGLYVKGSGKAILYELLVDGKEHKLADLQKHLSVDVRGRLRSLVKKGRETGRWSIHQSGDTVSMHLGKGAAA